MKNQGSASASRRGRIGSLLLTAALVVSGSPGATADTIRAVESTRDALAGTAAIVEGRVAAHTATYDDQAGPRTTATLIDLTSHFGTYQERTLPLATLGGRITDDRWLLIPELPRLTEDTRYLVFLTNADWFFSPVVADYLFRLEPGPRGGDVLIAPSGHAVVGLSAEGLEFSDEPVVDTDVDFLRPHAKPRVPDPALLAGALSKDDFLAGVRDLLQTTPLQGAFRPTPAADRVWNQTATSEEPPLR
jgi:hypothetical protein